MIAQLCFADNGFADNVFAEITESHRTIVTPAHPCILQMMVRARSPTTKFGSGGRFVAKPQDGPAPNAYGLPNKTAVLPRQASTKFPHAPRDQGLKMMAPVPVSPGPQYTPTVNFVRPKSPDTKFGTSNRFGAQRRVRRSIPTCAPRASATKRLTGEGCVNMLAAVFPGPLLTYWLVNALVSLIVAGLDAWPGCLRRAAAGAHSSSSVHAALPLGAVSRDGYLKPPDAATRQWKVGLTVYDASAVRRVLSGICGVDRLAIVAAWLQVEGYVMHA